jgi:hypothetical protein
MSSAIRSWSSSACRDTLLGKLEDEGCIRVANTCIVVVNYYMVPDANAKAKWKAIEKHGMKPFRKPEETGH